MANDVGLHKAALLEAMLQYDLDKSKGKRDSIRLQQIQLGQYHEGVSALMVASRYGYTELFMSLLEKTTNPHPFSSNITYKRSLLLAAADGHSECVCLLSRHALFNEYSLAKHHRLHNFITAVDTRDFDLIENLLDRAGGDSWIQGVEGGNVMSLLILHECPPKCLVSMVGHGASVNQHDRHGFTPLMMAVIAGRVDCAQALLQMKADVNLKDKKNPLLEEFWDYDLYSKDIFGNTGDGKTALMYAVNVNNLECVILLLRHRVKLDRSDESGFTALMHAVCAGNIECIKKILNSGLSMDINRKDSEKRTALVHAAYAGDTKSVKLLLKSKADPYQKDSNQRTAFMAAVIAKNTELALTLLKFPAEVDSKDLQGKTSLMYAAESGNVELLELLIKKIQGALHVKNNAVLDEVLIYALKSDDIECFKVLVQHGCDVNYRDSNGETPLMYACRNRNSQLFYFLVKCGAKLKTVDKSATSVLMHAIDSELEFVEFLLKNGVKVNCANCKGETPLMLACLQGRSDCVELLIQYGANVNAVDINKESVLTYTAKGFRHNVNCSELILDAGADVDMLNKYKHTVFSEALKPGCDTFLKFLIDRGNIFEDGQLKKVHRRAFKYNSLYSYSQRTMVLLMKSRIFKWTWYPKQTIRQQPFAAVVSGISPGVFYEEFCKPSAFSEPEAATFRNNNVLTPLQLAFLRIRPNMVRFLLVNLYFTMQDYKVLISNAEFRSTVKKYEYIPELILLFDQITTKPWSLQTLSLISISTSLALSESDLSRAEQVESLLIPDKFKTKLKFQGPLSQLCPEHWECIGKPPGFEERQDLLSLTQPVWPYPQFLTQCNKRNCHDCDGLGLALQS